MVFTLPKVSGPYAVGVTTFAAPISAQTDDDRIIGTAKLKAHAGVAGTPALELDEVVFTAYYPADAPSDSAGHKVGWVPKPIHGLMQGYVYFGEVGSVVKAIALAFSGLSRLFKFHATPNAKLLDPMHRSDAPGEPWPLVFFSHGLGGTRTTYSQYCSRLASQGNVVLAFEHRDGTGPFVPSRSPIPGDASNSAHAKGKVYTKPDDVTIDPEAKNQFPFRNEQLEFRRLELYFAYHTFWAFVTGGFDLDADKPTSNKIHSVDGPWNFKLQTRQHDREFWESWLPGKAGSKVQCEKDIVLTGHSFGGATMMSMLTNSAPMFGEHCFTLLPIRRVVVMDPWVEPLPSPGPSPLATEPSNTPPPLLVINSEAYTVWKENFEPLQGILQTWNSGDGDGARLVTVVRSQHQSFSDFPLLFSFGKNAQQCLSFLSTFGRLSLSFLDGNLAEALQEHTQTSGEVETTTDKDGKSVSRLVGNPGDIVVHI